jgi:DnaJ family protein A protein 5
MNQSSTEFTEAQCLRILGLPQTATWRDITRNYRQEMLRWAPDKNLNNTAEATARAQVINGAYGFLNELKQKREGTYKPQAYEDNVD